MARAITLTTDFGDRDPYVGIMKGVILGINPLAHLVDLCHQVTPQGVAEAAFMVGISHGYFPQGTIHLVVVDPGVGSERRSIILATPSAFFVAPDNGVLSYVIHEALAENGPRTWGQGQPTAVELEAPLRAVAITNPRYWLSPVSATFHGRDIFAPVAAHLSLGTPLDAFGEEVASVLCLPPPHPQPQPDGSLSGHVLHVDGFGNLITDIREKHLPDGPFHLQVAGRSIQGLSPYYAAEERLMAVVGSSGYVEVAVRQGSAARLLGVGRGEAVRVIPD